MFKRLWLKAGLTPFTGPAQPGPEREPGSPSVYLTASSSAGTESDSSSQGDVDRQTSVKVALEAKETAGFDSAASKPKKDHPRNDPDFYVYAHRAAGDPQKDNPWFDRFEYVPSRRPVVVDYGKEGPQWEARESKKRTADGLIKEPPPPQLLQLQLDPAPERYEIVSRTESRSHIPLYILKDRQSPKAPRLRVSIFDITDYISLCTLHAFENDDFESAEPPESDFMPWDEKYPMLKEVLDTAAGRTKPKVEPRRNPNIEVVIFTNVKKTGNGEVPSLKSMSASSAQSHSPTITFQPKRQTLAKLEDDSVADSQLVDTLMQEAADAEVADEMDESRDYAVSRILDHKDWLGVRHYQVQWANVSRPTWVNEEQLEGAESADEAIQRYLDSDGSEDEESGSSGGDVVARIAGHKDWKGVRYFQVEWVNASLITWVSEEELDGIDGADDAIRQYLEAGGEANGKKEEAKTNSNDTIGEDDKG